MIPQKEIKKLYKKKELNVMNGGFYGWLRGRSRPSGVAVGSSCVMDADEEGRLWEAVCVAMDEEDSGSVDMEAHDKRFHGGEYKEGQQCKYREDLAKEDKVDDLGGGEAVVTKPKEGKARALARQMLEKKRQDLSSEQINELLDGIFAFGTSKERKAALHWAAKGAIRLPEDAPKVREALGYAERGKKDAMQYDSPMALINSLADFKPKARPISVEELKKSSLMSDYRDEGYGVETFEVEDSREGQELMREVINTHWGKDANPWCLLHGDGEGNLSDGEDGEYDAWEYWQHYDGLPKRVAFKDGKLLAFMGTGTEEEQWWDRMDKSHEGIPMDSGLITEEDAELLRSKNPGIDMKGIRGEYELNRRTHKKERVGNKQFTRGDKRNGLYEEWDKNGQMAFRGNYKDGEPEGEREEWYDNGQMSKHENYKDGKKDGLHEWWYGNGQKESRRNYKDGEKDGLQEGWYENGQMLLHSNYKAGKLDGLQEEWYANGQQRYKENYKDGKRNGLQEGWYENGQQRYKENYKDGENDGLQEWWYENGQKESRRNYKDGEKDGLQEGWYRNGQKEYRSNYKYGKMDGLREEWYNNGQKEDRYNYKDGKLDGLQEGWHKNGQQKYKENYKDDEKDGLQETWYENGQIAYRGNLKDRKREGLQEEWYENGKKKSRGNYKDGEPEGLQESWHDNGQIASRGNYKAGKMEGQIEAWYANGDVKYRYIVKDGKPVREL